MYVWYETKSVTGNKETSVYVGRCLTHHLVSSLVVSFRFCVLDVCYICVCCLSMTNLLFMNGLIEVVVSSDYNSHVNLVM